MDEKLLVKLPQNIQALIGEIGEKQVLLRLAILVHQTKWSVFYNLGEVGYDILVMNTETNERIRLEVKARQKIYSTGKHSRGPSFQLTDSEYKACDFLVAYFLDNNSFFIVPKIALKKVIVNSKNQWRFILSYNLQGEPHPSTRIYRGAWRSLHPDFQLSERLIDENINPS